MQTLIVIGNWKMNGKKAEALQHLSALVAGVEKLPGEAEVVVCPPATLLDAFVERTVGARVGIGGQDCLPDQCGARTGDINAELLADIGVRMVILGHSERRQYHNELDSLIRSKVEGAWASGLIAVVCVGESHVGLNPNDALAVVTEQLEASLPEGVTDLNTVVAYEPVWAIGTGRKPGAEYLAFICREIRAYLCDRFGMDRAPAVLYGGSVDASNAESIMRDAAFDGLLVGRASLAADEFVAITAGCIRARGLMHG